MPLCRIHGSRNFVGRDHHSLHCIRPVGRRGCPLTRAPAQNTFFRRCQGKGASYVVVQDMDGNVRDACRSPRPAHLLRDACAAGRAGIRRLRELVVEAAHGPFLRHRGELPVGVQGRGARGRAGVRHLQVDARGRPVRTRARLAIAARACAQNSRTHIGL
jgi:hypothetical protein